MIPAVQINVIDQEELVSVSKTYQVDQVNKRIKGYVDGIVAMKQAIEKILLTQRQAWLIYPIDYGIETERLIGKEMEFVLSDIQRTVTESLITDDRVKDVSDFVSNIKQDSLHISFTVNTIYGNMKIDSEVPV